MHAATHRSPGPTQRTVRLLVVLLVVAALAGCVGEPSTPPLGNEETLPTATAATLEDGTPAQLATYPFAAAIHEERWFNGTFQPQEHCFPVGCAPAILGVAPPPIRFYDITELVPKNTPAWITIEVDEDLAQGDFDIWVAMDFNDIWTGRWDAPRGGYSHIEVLAMRLSDTPVRAAIVYDELEYKAEVPYALMVRVDADPERLVEAVPVGIELAPGDRLRFEFDEAGDEPFLAMWGPEDDFIDHFAVNSTEFEIAVPADAVPGEHVLLLSDGAGSARLYISGSATPPLMRPLAPEIVMNQREFDAANDVEWDFRADRRPIQIGVNLMQSPTVSDAFTGILSSPSGPILEATVTGGPWVRPLAGIGVGLWTIIGSPDNEAGDYHAEMHFETAAGPDPILAMDYVVYYQR